MLFVHVVSGDRENIEAVELERVPGAHEVICAVQLFFHGGGRDQCRFLASYPGDVVFRKIVVLQIREEREIHLGILVHAMWVHVGLQALPSDSNGGAAKPCDALK